MKADLNAWRRERRWFMHHLRHAAATLDRRENGQEASARLLGQASAWIADAECAERDWMKVVGIMRLVG